MGDASGSLAYLLLSAMLVLGVERRWLIPQYGGRFVAEGLVGRLDDEVWKCKLLYRFYRS